MNDGSQAPPTDLRFTMEQLSRERFWPLPRGSVPGRRTNWFSSPLRFQEAGPGPVRTFHPNYSSGWRLHRPHGCDLDLPYLHL